MMSLGLICVELLGVAIPLISVCLPTYNGEKYLEAAIESVLNQTVSDLELQIGDDCSGAATRALLLDFAAQDSRIKLIFNEKNLGYVPNGAAIMQRCQGRYIKTFAQDDILEPECCAKELEAIENNPEVSLVSCSRTHIDEDDRVLGTHHHFAKTQMMPGKELIELYLREFICRTGNPSQLFFKREHVGTGFNTAYHHSEDVELGLRILEKGSFYYIAESLVRYRVHEETTTISTFSDMSFMPDHARLIEQFGHYARAGGVSNAQVWDASINGLMRKMSNAMFTRMVEYEDFPTPAYFGKAEAADKNVIDEPEIFRKLACHLLKFLTEKNLSWNESHEQNLRANQDYSAYKDKTEARIDDLVASNLALTRLVKDKESEIERMRNSRLWKLNNFVRKLLSAPH